MLHPPVTHPPVTFLGYTFPELLNIPKACKRISRVGVRKMNPKKGKGYSRRKKWHFTLSSTILTTKEHLKELIQTNREIKMFH